MTDSDTNDRAAPRDKDLLFGVMAVSPDGHLATSVSFDNTARVWELPSGKLARTISGHEVGLQAVDFSAGDDYIIKVWPLDRDMLTEKPEEIFAETERATGMELDGFKLVPAQK